MRIFKPGLKIMFIEQKDPEGNVNEKYLLPTSILDSDNETVKRFADEAAGNADDPVGVAVKLYYAVRDRIWYDPYYPFYLPDHYRASSTVRSGRGFCIPKAALLCAVGRAKGIPARLGFANVRNHLATRQLLDYMGTDIFAYHGFTEFYLEGKWVRATPAFNSSLCLRHNVAPLSLTAVKIPSFMPITMRTNHSWSISSTWNI